MTKTITEKVFIYRNLTKKCFSVRSCKTGLVIAHLDRVIIKNPVFKVSEAGRQRVLREKRKNVHAGVEGFLIPETNVSLSIRITYDPYKFDSFVIGGDPNKKVASAEYAVLSQDGVFAHNPSLK